MICPSCGADVPESKVCEKCGTSLSEKFELSNIFERHVTRPDDEESEPNREDREFNGQSAEMPEERIVRESQQYGQAALLEVATLAEPAVPGSVEGADDPEAVGEPAAEEAEMADEAASDVAEPVAATSEADEQVAEEEKGADEPAIEETEGADESATEGTEGAEGTSAPATDTLDPRSKSRFPIPAIAIAVIVMALCAIGIAFAVTNSSGETGSAPRNGGDVDATRPSSTQGSQGQGASQGSSQAGTASATNSTAFTSSSGSANSQGNATASISAYRTDARGNISLYALCELAGRELLELLDDGNYTWYDDLGWMNSRNSLFSVEGSSGILDKGEVADLAVGGKGTAAYYTLMAEGYATPEEALTALAANVTLIDQSPTETLLFARVVGPSGNEFLVAVSTVREDSQMLIAFNAESIEQGLFSELVGADVGTTIDEVWQYCRS